MIRFAALCLLASLTSAAAQDVLDSFRGQYGSATDPVTSCAANPHSLDFMTQPPHALFNWSKPWTDDSGRMVSNQRYDLLSTQDNSLILRLEGDTRRTASGDRPIWILRQTATPQGYCWGRTDWPLVHCENQQLRCDNPTS
ncbi:MAG: hypothetical protein ACOH2H_04275 [Cypionkella sp.]